MKNITRVQIVIRNNAIFVDYTIDEDGQERDASLGAYDLTPEAQSLIDFGWEKVREKEKEKEKEGL